MNRNTPTALGSCTRTAERTIRARRTERKGLCAGGRSRKSRRRLPGRTRHPVLIQVNVEVALDEQAVSGDFPGNLRQQFATRFGERRSGRTAAVSAVGARLDHRQPGVLLGLRHQRKRSRSVARIACDHLEGDDELAFLVYGDIGLMPVETLGGALPAVAHLGIGRRRHPPLGRAFLYMRLFRAVVALFDLDILQKQLFQEQSRLAHLGEGGSGKRQQTLCIRNDLGEQGVLGVLVGPVEIGAALDTVVGVAVEAISCKKVVWLLSLLLRKRSAQLPDPAREEIEGVLHRSSSPYGLGVEGDLERLSFEEAGALGFLETGLEDGLYLRMQDEVCAEELEGTLGAEGLSGFSCQNSGPAQVVGGSVDGFFVGDTRLVLEESCECEQGGGNAGPSLLVFVECGEIFVFKEPGCREGKLSMEALGCKFEIEDVSDVEQGFLWGPFTDHRNALLICFLLTVRFDMPHTNSFGVCEIEADFSATLLGSNRVLSV